MMIRINLLPTEGKGQKRVYTQLALMVSMLVASVAIIGYLWYSQVNLIEEKDREIAEKRRLVVQLQETIKKVEEFERKRNVIKDKLNVITDSKVLQKLPVLMMMELVESTPDQIWLTSLTIDSGAFQVVGFALSYNAIGNYLESIEAARFFMGPELQSAVRTVYGGREVISFQMYFSLDGSAIQQINK